MIFLAAASPICFSFSYIKNQVRMVFEKNTKSFLGVSTSIRERAILTITSAGGAKLLKSNLIPFHLYCIFFLPEPLC